MAQSLTAHIHSYYNNLSKADQAICDYLMSEMDAVPTMTIQEIAEQTNISTATISRFAKKIGFDSFQELKLAAHGTSAASEKTDFFSELSDEDSAKDILVKNFNNSVSSLNATLTLLSEKDLEQAMSYLLKAKSCGFFGLGSSNAVALIAYHKFLRMPLSNVYHQDFHYQQMLAAKLTAKDCAFVISHTGKNKDALRILEILQEHGVPVIAITSFANSPLANQADVALISAAEEVAFRPEAVTSTVSQISLMDALFMIYAMKSKQKVKPSLQNIRDVIQATRLDS